MGKLDSRTSTVDRQMGNDLLEDLLHEKSLDLDKFKGAKPVTREQLSLRQVSDKVIETRGKFEISELSVDDLDSMSED